MLFQFYFKRMPSSEALKSMSEKKLLDVIERFLGNSGQVRVTFSSERTVNKVHCAYRGGNGTVLHASAAGENMFAIIDTVAQKVEAQLARQKMRMRRRLRLLPVQKRSLKLVDAQELKSADAETSWLEELDAWEPAQTQRYIQ